MNAKDRLIVALDFPTIEEAKGLVEVLGESVSVYKVGLEMFLNSKGEAVDYLSSLGKKVFLDLKFHDIPNTTMMASVFAAKQNVFMFNVHAAGGRKMMKSVSEEVKKINPDALAIAVTVLTSFSDDEIKELYQTEHSIKELAMHWAKVTKESGMDGVVCSPWEASAIKEKCGKDFKTICPGVRPKWAAANDQQRIMTPKDAILKGCDYLVVGRPITKADDPVNAAELVLGEIKEGLAEAKVC
ncbi:orotidine-5'-phosphate decarboxylase [Ilyobacter polytropus]|uniref:Orotidine 5'-phosphate decarboxylase n=1 Tax=Ilyobacter polytropus (strain ATCC 51220 / DSM 2926 / LMG 16218 / CuHBu1) TaxID=572544 RepID=E3HDR0_ILYPC|nr:orotidine-5'-phosphate decarboxylase [Ilyobacter polytropus]ADO84246.1 orotidine 5'-phosphate decarboxylase [Ilyobacter polytropus DSM 2926]